MRAVFLIAAALAVAVPKYSVTLQQERPQLEAPRLQGTSTSKWCPLQNSVDYVCLETNVNLKAGWKISQSWTTATDINPVAPA
jgi:hypothetical protein